METNHYSEDKGLGIRCNSWEGHLGNKGRELGTQSYVSPLYSQYLSNSIEVNLKGPFPRPRASIDIKMASCYVNKQEKTCTLSWWQK